MSANTTTKPIETLSIDPENPLDKSIVEAIRQMNQEDTGRLIETLKNKVEHSKEGVAFAILNGNSEEDLGDYSKDEALVVFNAYAQTATPNQLVRAELLRRVAAFNDIRDEAGKLKPVIMLAGPGIGGSHFNLSTEDRHQVKAGELGPAARELLRAVSEKEIGKVSLLGFSQGADMALAGARSAYHANLDTKIVAVGDPASVEDRTQKELSSDFRKAGMKDLKAAIKATGLDAQKKAINSVDFVRFGASTVYPLNKMLSAALGHNTFEQRVQTILDEGAVAKLVVGYGENSAITKPEKIEPAIERLLEANGADVFMPLMAEGSKHTWGDQMTLLYKLYMRALKYDLTGQI